MVFNLNMACPYMMISYARDSFLKRSVEYFGQEYADGIGKLAGLIMIIVSIVLLSGGGLLLIAGFILYKLTDNS